MLTKRRSHSSLVCGVVALRVMTPSPNVGQTPSFLSEMSSNDRCPLCVARGIQFHALLLYQMMMK